MRADALAVLREARLAELAHQRGELLRRERLLERIGARRGVALRQVRQPDQRLARQVEHQVEAFLARLGAVRAKSIAFTGPQALTQSRCDLHLSRSIW